MDDEKSTSATVQEAGHQPVNSLDPKQWSTYKKHVFLAIISIAAFIPDFGSSMGIPAVIPQSTYVRQLRTQIPARLTRPGNGSCRYQRPSIALRETSSCLELVA